MATNITEGEKVPSWGQAQYKYHSLFEPILIVCVMLASLYFNRARGFRILDTGYRKPLLDDPDDDSMTSMEMEEDEPTAYTQQRSKTRNCCGLLIHTPNSARFANHLHSRLLQKFPFLVEMFYWVLNVLFYVLTKPIAAKIAFDEGLRETAQKHGISLLKIEHESSLSFLFPLREIDIQSYLIEHHRSALSFLNSAYSLVHIPGTVIFLSWYYFSAPTHNEFAIVRRTMTLSNLFAFLIFTLWPCMPPRLLPESFGFKDTVRQDDVESVWLKGDYANQLAAMPSLHFAYAFSIGCTLIYHSGVFRKYKCGSRPARLTQAVLVAMGIMHPALVLTVIIATANHYWMDALVASFVVFAALLLNRVFMVLLPLEDWFLWCFRLEKPVPTTGRRFRSRS